MAIAIAASAAAMAITNKLKNKPSAFSGYRYLLKTTKLMLTLFRINSIDMSMVIIFLRVKKPYAPIKKRAVLTIRKCEIGTLMILADFF